MKRRELILDDVPAPGEPLTPRIHPENVEILNEEIEYRASLMVAKLKPRVRRRLLKRYMHLQRQLNKAQYNQLVIAFWERRQAFEQVKHEYDRDQPTGKALEKLKRRARGLIADARSINRRMNKFKPLVDEFENISSRLKSHDRAVAFEQEERENERQFRREARTWEAQIKAVFKQSKRLHHRFEDSQGKWHTVIPRFERILFKNDRVYFRLQITAQGVIDKLLGRYRDVLPYDVDITALESEETLLNLSAACRRVVTTERSKSGFNVHYVISRLDSPDGIPARILYGKVIDWYPVEKHSQTPWAGGVSERKVVEWYTFEENPHVLIAGSTQSGKSNHVNQMISTLVTMNTPSELRLVLVDNKGGIEFVHWQELKHLLRPVVKTPSDVLPALRWLRGLMEQRLGMFEKMHAKNLASYNQKVHTDSRLARIVVFIDEMATLIGLGDLTSDIHTELRVISSQGRAVGIHLVICTQHSSVDVLPGWIKTNMTLRISGKMPSHQASMVILDSVTAATLPNVPGRLVVSQGRFEDIVQSPFISDDEIARAITIANAHGEPDQREYEQPEAIAPREAFGRDDLLEMVINHTGMKLSANRVHDIIGNEVLILRSVRAIVEAIKDEFDQQGCIEHRGVEYTLRRVGKSYRLEPMEQVMEQDENADSVPSAVPLNVTPVGLEPTTN